MNFSQHFSNRHRWLWVAVYLGWIVTTVAFLISIYARSLNWLFCSMIWAVGTSFNRWIIKDEENYEDETNDPLHG